MKPEDFLQEWKRSPKVVEDLIYSGVEITKLVTRYFLFKNIEPNAHNLAIIRDEVLKYCVSVPKIKLIDISLAIELYKVNDDNNISAAHVISLIKKYSLSEFRKKLFKLYQDEPDDKLPEAAKEYDSAKLLRECFEWFKRTGEINLNTGKVYTSNFALISEKLGEKLYDLIEDTQSKLCESLTNRMHTVKGYAECEDIKREILSIQDEFKYYLEHGKLNGKSLLRNEVRRSHLKELFIYHPEVVQNNFIHS